MGLADKILQKENSVKQKLISFLIIEYIDGVSAVRLIASGTHDVIFMKNEIFIKHWCQINTTHTLFDESLGNDALLTG